MTRRDFNRTGALAAAVFAAAPFMKAETYDYPWKLGIITDEVSPDLSVVLSRFYPKYQLQWAEIRNLKLDGSSKYVYKTATPAQIKQIKSQLDSANIKLSILDTGIYKIPLPGTSPEPDKANDLNPVSYKFEGQMEDLKKAADAAHALGTDRLRIFTFRRVDDPQTVFSRIVDELGKALKVAKEQDVVLLVENEHSCNTATGTETAQLFKAVSDKRLMHVWDPGNCFEGGEEPFPKAWDMLDHSRIGHIHLKDAAGKDWKPIGGGKIDFNGQFTALKKMKYSGTLSLETHYRNAQKDIYTSSVESMDGLVHVLKQV